MIHNKNSMKKQLLANFWKEDFITNLDSEMKLKIYCEFQHLLDHLLDVKIFVNNKLDQS